MYVEYYLLNSKEIIIFVQSEISIGHTHTQTRKTFKARRLTISHWYVHVQTIARRQKRKYNMAMDASRRPLLNSFVLKCHWQTNLALIDVTYLRLVHSTYFQHMLAYHPTSINRLDMPYQINQTINKNFVSCKFCHKQI